VENKEDHCMGLSRRVFAVLTCTAIVAGACGSSSATQAPAASTAPSAQASTATTAPTAAPTASSADFKFLIDSEPSTLVGAADDLPTSWFDLVIYNALYTLDNKLAPQPDLAAAMPTTSADGLTWTVKLRTDAKFHDGTAVTADDVVFSYQILMSKNCGQNPDLCSQVGDNVQTVTAVDPATVQLVLKTKYAPFQTTLAAVWIMPKKAISDSMARLAGSTGSLAAQVATEDKKVGDAMAPRRATAATSSPQAALRQPTPPRSSPSSPRPASRCPTRTPTRMPRAPLTSRRTAPNSSRTSATSTRP